jgi:hypothetical protein
MAKITDDPKVADAIEKAAAKARKTAIAECVAALKPHTEANKEVTDKPVKLAVANVLKGITADLRAL